MTVQSVDDRAWPPIVHDRDSALRFLVRHAVGPSPEEEDRAVAMYVPDSAGPARTRLLVESLSLLRWYPRAGLLERWEASARHLGAAWSSERVEVLLEVLEAGVGAEAVSVLRGGPRGDVTRDVGLDAALHAVATAVRLEWKPGRLRHELEVWPADGGRPVRFGVAAPFGYGPVSL